MNIAESVVRLSQDIISNHLVGLNKHGNISIRDLHTGHIWMSGSSLRGLEAGAICVVDIDGNVLEGDMRGTEKEVIAMHTEVYRARKEVTCVVHTHAPHVTAFAVASKPLSCVAESMARQGIIEPIPVVPYAPRGSNASVNGIVSALHESPNTPGVLLESHGVLICAKDENTAIRQLMAMEEGAQLALLASSLGGQRGLSRTEAEAALFR